jgi:pyruvate kinase
VESDPNHWAEISRDIARPEHTTADAIARGAADVAGTLDCATIVAYTDSGSTALRLARERPRSGIIGMTPRIDTARRLCLAWGVRSIVTEDAQNTDDMVTKAEKVVRDLEVARSDDRIVITAGVPFGRPGKTNMLRIVRLD